MQALGLKKRRRSIELRNDISKFVAFHDRHIIIISCSTSTPHQFNKSIAHMHFMLQAGPPYEDIAFRIVRKEWNYARKHGFRCSFERGILHLFFNFKRARYRR